MYLVTTDVAVELDCSNPSLLLRDGAPVEILHLDRDEWVPNITPSIIHRGGPLIYTCWFAVNAATYWWFNTTLGAHTGTHIPPPK